MQELVLAIEAETEARHLAERTKPLGVRQVWLQDPHEMPIHSKRSPAPLFHCASKVAHDLLKGAYAAFNHAFREAARRWQRGELDTEFPAGAFPPPVPFQHLSQVTG